jgi:nucleotide-binding universal stress UspA family protein
MTSTRILVPLDGTPEANSALPLARTLARVTDASVTLLQVMRANDSEGARFARSNLEQIAREMEGSGLQVESIIRQGHAAEQILQEMRATPVQLIVMRTHGRGGFERAMLGSVTEHVLKEAQVPIVLLRPGGRRVTRLQKLLVPLDGTPGGALGLGMAVGLARPSEAALHLLQVVVPITMQTLVAYEYGGIGYYDPVWDEEAQTSAKAYVDAMVSRLADTGLTATGETIVAPNVPQGIIDTAARDAADMIVMSTHALTGPARAVLGSMADAVVRRAPCPVLLVRRTAADEDAPAAEAAIPATQPA